jgi:ParB-like chromosome segregation protein Spo0J
MMLAKITKLKGNPSNPRVLRDDKFLKLKASIEAFPDMLQKRPIVAVTDKDGKLMVLGGNMRLKACADLGMKEVPVILADEWTEEQRREFIIKDNVGFGEWDWDALANKWDAGKLDEWGLNIPAIQDFSGVNAEVNTDSFADEVSIVLKYSAEDYSKVREALSKVAATPEQAVWKLLNL